MTASSKIKIHFLCERCGSSISRFRRSDSKFRFCSSKCALPGAIEASRLVDRSGEKNPAWRGGKRHALGYVYVLSKDHPKANNKGYVQEHRLVMEKHLGRYLSDSEKVHHLNGNKTDNRLKNLQLLNSQSEHIKLHREGLVMARWSR